MKILYVANERRAAGVAARALSGTIPNAALTWAQTLSSAVAWVLANRDAAAVIVGAEVQGHPCAWFVEQLRGSGLTTPVVVVASEQPGAPLTAITAGADGYVFDGESLEADLPRAVTAVIERERSRRDLVERKLAQMEAARAGAEQRLVRAEEARQETEQRYAAELSVAASRLADIEARHTASSARDARICTALQQRLLELENALERADERRAAEAAAAAGQVAKRHAEFTASLTEAAHARDTLTAKLSVATAALDEAQRARRAEAAAAAEHLARREAELGDRLAEAAAGRAALEGALTEARTAHQHVQQRAAADLAVAADREAALQDRLAQEAAARTVLEQRFGAAEAARQDLEQRYAMEVTAAAMRLADVQARFDVALTENGTARAALEQQLAEAAAAIRRAAQERESEAAAASAHLARRQAEMGALLAEAAASRIALEGALTDAKAARHQALQRAAADLAAAGEREAALEDLLAQEAERRTILEQKYAAADAARQDAEQRYATEMPTLTMRLADAQARHDAALAENDAVRAALEQELAAAAAHLARREAELAGSLADAVAEKTALEGALSEREAAHQRVEHRASADLAAAAAREAELVERLEGESVVRGALERDLAESRAEAGRARRRFLHVVSSHRRRTREHQARLEAQLTAERAEAERQRTAQHEEIGRVQQERDTLRHLLGTAQEQLERLHSTLDAERKGHERARAANESELQRLSAESDQLRRSLDQLRTAFQAMEQIAGEHAIERARLESIVSQRDGELSAQAVRQLAAEQAAQAALSQAQEELRRTVESSSADVTRLEREIEALRRGLDAARSRGEALRKDAERLPHLQMQLEQTQTERRREFERAPYGLCQCTRDGVITEVNHSLVRLLGYRRARDLMNVDLAATGAECPDDVRWLIERAVSTGKTETVETTWKGKDRSRLVVRLQALSRTSGTIGILVEDITALRALEQRLREAQRLEAVGRLASEVAVTCDAVLRDAARDGDRWLAAIGSDVRLRHQGELILREVRRAATFLRQFALQGGKMSAREPVSVPRVFRDLEPVLKRIVGDDVELVFAATSPSLDVDLDAERLQRVFVNVAYYARERMPHGGRVRIHAAATVVGRRFVARYPNARQGPHVLITVAERRRAARQDPDVDVHGLHAPADDERSSPEAAGVEVGALLELVVNCGGHLWMEAEPAGNMMLKIHLPKRPADELTPSAVPGAPSDRGRGLAKWFRGKSAAVADS